MFAQIEVSELVNYDRLHFLIIESGKTKAHLCRKMNKPTYYLRDAFRQRTNIPNTELTIMADELNTTAAYLKGETDKKNKSTDEGELSAAKLMLINKVRELPEETVKAMLALAEQVI